MRLLIIGIFCLASFTVMAQGQPVQPALQVKYLPKEIKDLYIGMSKEELQKRHQALKESDVLGYPEENFEKGNVKTITYQFNNDSNSLYEFIVEYRNEATAIAIAKKLYKLPNDVSKNFPLAWKIKLQDGLTLKCWIFHNKICIADESQF